MTLKDRVETPIAHYQVIVLIENPLLPLQNSVLSACPARIDLSSLYYVNFLPGQGPPV